MRLLISMLTAVLLVITPLSVFALELGLSPDGGILVKDIAEEPDEIPAEAVTYTVQEGDTLYRIAYNHGIPLDDLLSWNDLNSTIIYPGDELHVVLNTNPIKRSPVPQKKPPVPVAATEKPVKELTVTATAYTAYCEGCSGTTYSGQNLRANPNQKVIAVDPGVVPIGSRVWVENYGEAIAGDIGGAIKGHKIDVFIPSYERAMEWGVKKIKIRILD